MTEEQGAQLLTELATLNRLVWHLYGIVGGLCLICLVLMIVQVAHFVAGYMGSNSQS